MAPGLIRLKPARYRKRPRKKPKHTPQPPGLWTLPTNPGERGRAHTRDKGLWTLPTPGVVGGRRNPAQQRQKWLLDPVKLFRPQKRIAHEVEHGRHGLVFAVCGRRFGKTYMAAQLAAQLFLTRQWNILYAAPSLRQADVFWDEVVKRLRPLIRQGLLTLNKQRRILQPAEWTGMRDRARINAVHTRDPDKLRGGWGNLMILDEYQDQSDYLFERVVQPMRIDEAGKVLFLFTPPNVLEEKKTGRNHMHARDLVYRLKGIDPEGPPNENAIFFNYPASANPIARDSGILEEIRGQVSDLTYRQEIEAQLIGDNPGAMWERGMIRYAGTQDWRALDLIEIVVGVDPSAGGYSDTGIVVVGKDRAKNLYVLADYSVSNEGYYGDHRSVRRWAERVNQAARDFQADRIVTELNYGAALVKEVLAGTGMSHRVVGVRAMRGKELRADPVVAIYEQERVWHLRPFGRLEDQMCSWVPGTAMRVDRVDAMVWAAHHLAIVEQDDFFLYTPGGQVYDDYGIHDSKYEHFG